ncbi:MAG: serine hydrolase domain-containing protein [Acidimicrobiales bacterium]
MRALDAVATWPAHAAAGAVVAAAAGSPAAGPGKGCALAGTYGDVDRTFPWASVTKLCTALAVLVAVEEGTVALDDAAGPPGATVAHLLSHASGLAPQGRRAITGPGRRRIYSNAGFELLGELVAARSGMAFASYLREAVLEPLGVGSRLVAGGSPASGMHGTLADLLALGAELLRPTVVAPETLAVATTVAFPDLPGVLPGFGRQVPCDWGLGFEIRDGKEPHWTGRRNDPGTFGHFGQSGAFLWVDPEAGVACGSLADRDFGPWAAAAWPALSDAVLGELAFPAADAVPGGPPTRPPGSREDGWYDRPSI